MTTEAVVTLRPGRRRRAGGARLRDRPWYPGVKRASTILFFVAVIGLVANHARHVDWGAVWNVLRDYSAGTLLLAVGFAAASHALYCGYDLVGRHETGHGLPARKVVGVGFTCYAFNLNLGSLVGGVALRYRLYARLGLHAETTTRILALSLLTNWLGYCCVAGCVFILAPAPMPPGWELGSEGLRWVGVGLLLAAAAYVAVCSLSKRREWQFRGHAVRLPSGRIAALQLVLSAANWMMIGAVVWVLLQHKIDYPSALGVLLIAAVAGVIAHVPAGLGVLEAVFIALLSHRVPQGELLAALLAYRAIYYLAPLALALGLFFRLDADARRNAPAPDALRR
ncbi:MAG: lysylphosphatidylglycerol synthase domain-containing protein [Caldimonas sp.]